TCRRQSPLRSGPLICADDMPTMGPVIAQVGPGWTMSNLPAVFASTARRLLPIFDWVSAYRREWLLPDVLAGVALWAVMVPEGMAYAGIVGVPPIMGLYTIVPALIAYALLGTSRQL